MWLAEVQEVVGRSTRRTAPWPELEDVLPDQLLREVVSKAIEELVSVPLEPLPVTLTGIAFPRPTEDARRGALVSQWLVRRKAWGFVGILAARILDRASCSREELRDVLIAALRRAMGLRDEREASILWLEAAELADAISERVLRCPSEDPVVYAHDVRLMRRGMVTPIGSVLTRLDGRAALRWLLTIEVLQATGPTDDARLSQETARYLLATPRQIIATDEWDLDVIDFPHSWSTLDRLERLGLLRTGVDPREPSYELRESGVALLTDVLAPDSAFRAVAGALLEEDSASRIAEGEQLVVASNRRATEWVVETMAHGLRNALGPVSFALEGLANDVATGGPAADRVARVRSGVERAFKLVSDLVALHRASQSPAETFEISAAVRDALAIANGSGVAVDLDRTQGRMVRGQRLRLVHALVELVRNARQHPRGPGTVEVRVRGDVLGSEVVITVDDDGLGVPPGLRERIFERGFSTRPEGTGQGLALLREVVEGEYGGDIAVDESPLGGASFRVSLRLA